MPLITLSYQHDGITEAVVGGRSRVRTPTSLRERTNINYRPHPTIFVFVVFVTLYAERRVGEVSSSVKCYRLSFASYLKKDHRKGVLSYSGACNSL